MNDITKNIPVGIFIGRFQPIHLGHIDAIKYALSNCEKLVIIIQKQYLYRTAKNFFYYNEVIDMIKLCFTKEELYNENGQEIKFHCIIYTISTQEEMEEIFKLRNYSRPVPDFILSPPLGKQQLIREINRFMMELPLTKLPKPGSNVNRPHINIAVFMKYLTDSELLNQCQTLHDFSIKFWEINEKIRKNSLPEDYRKKHKITSNMLEIINKNTSPKIFIGLCTDYSRFDDLL